MDDGRCERERLTLGELQPDLVFVRNYIVQLEEINRIHDRELNGMTEILRVQMERIDVDAMISKSEKALANLERFQMVLGRIAAIGLDIREISTQVNLLSINAAIEAAHAKEAGRGFAVVAEEIKKLSDRTRKSVEEISETVVSIGLELGAVRESIEEVQGRMADMKEFSLKIVQSVQHMKEIARRKPSQEIHRYRHRAFRAHEPADKESFFEIMISGRKSNSYTHEIFHVFGTQEGPSTNRVKPPLCACSLEVVCSFTKIPSGECLTLSFFPKKDLHLFSR
ncbi:MAG: Methyl-accepting chemotaxis sensory transducer, partial [Leptospirillum sp. Group IV 'UBA BS']